jgi:hypothetical protein
MNDDKQEPVLSISQKLSNALNNKEVDLEEIKKLVKESEQGVDTEMPDEDLLRPNFRAVGGFRLIDFSAMTGNLKVVQYLLENSANVLYRRNSFEQNPLHSAALSGNPEIFAAILEKIPAKKLPEILLQKTILGKKPLELLAEHVQDQEKQKEIKEFAKHIGGILREDNPGLRTSLKKKIFDFLKTIFRNSAKTKLFDGVDATSSTSAKIKEGLIKRMNGGETSHPPSSPPSSKTVIIR